MQCFKGRILYSMPEIEYGCSGFGMTWLGNVDEALLSQRAHLEVCPIQIGFRIFKAF